jgi:hypothetical protein
MSTVPLADLNNVLRVSVDAARPRRRGDRRRRADRIGVSQAAGHPCTNPHRLDCCDAHSASAVGHLRRFECTVTTAAYPQRPDPRAVQVASGSGHKILLAEQRRMHVSSRGRRRKRWRSCLLGWVGWLGCDAPAVADCLRHSDRLRNGANRASGRRWPRHRDRHPFEPRPWRCHANDWLVLRHGFGGGFVGNHRLWPRHFWSVAIRKRELCGGRRGDNYPQHKRHKKDVRFSAQLAI